MTVCAIRQEPMELSPMLKADFIWPSMTEIKEVQQADQSQSADAHRMADGLLLNEDGRVWIPDTATSLQLRLCIVAHFGPAGHRGVKTTLDTLRDKFVWRDMHQDVEDFVKRCLHCASTTGGPPSTTTSW
ncbi:hypothetical protein PINS_up023758 [Pythium insidiosum]|nr:hypothetical protein PINS_up023758 [Pythium insidiosum]